MNETQANVPEKYLCKLSNQIMIDPVWDDFGNYEREAIMSYFENSSIHPVSCKVTKTKNLPSNDNLRLEIKKWLEKNPQCTAKQYLTLMLNATPNDISQVMRCVALGAPVTMRFLFKDDTISGTILHWAAKLGHFRLVKMVLEKGADVNERTTPIQVTALGIAASGDHLEIVRELLNHGADPNIKFDRDTTAIMGACSVGNLEMVQLLVEKGASIYDRDNKNITILHRAVDSANVKLIEYLIKLGLYINITDGEGYTPLYQAIWNNDTTTIKYLLLNKASVSVRTDTGFAALHLCVQTDDLNVLHVVIDHCDDMEARTIEGKTALTLAVQLNKIAHADMLLQAYSDPCTMDNLGNSPLHYAVGRRNISMIQLLIRHGADAYQLNKDMQTPLDLGDDLIRDKIYEFRSFKAKDDPLGYILHLESKINQHKSQMIAMKSLASEVLHQAEEIKKLKEKNRNLEATVANILEMLQSKNNVI